MSSYNQGSTRVKCGTIGRVQCSSCNRKVILCGPAAAETCIAADMLFSAKRCVQVFIEKGCSTLRSLVPGMKSSRSDMRIFTPTTFFSCCITSPPCRLWSNVSSRICLAPCSQSWCHRQSLSATKHENCRLDALQVYTNFTDPDKPPPTKRSPITAPQRKLDNVVQGLFHCSQPPLRQDPKAPHNHLLEGG